MTAEEIARLRTLHEAATPGPWHADTATAGDAVVWGPGEDEFIANVGARISQVAPREQVLFDIDAANAELAAAARNALPALLDALDAANKRAEEAERERDEAVALHDDALRGWSQSNTDCVRAAAERDAAIAETAAVVAAYEADERVPCETCKGTGDLAYATGEPRVMTCACVCGTVRAPLPALPEAARALLAAREVAEAVLAAVDAGGLAVRCPDVAKLDAFYDAVRRYQAAKVRP